MLDCWRLIYYEGKLVSQMATLKLGFESFKIHFESEKCAFKTEKFDSHI